MISGYQTITKKMTDYKVGRGKWNLEVTKEAVQELEVSYTAPAALPAIEQNLIPQKDDTFVQFGNFRDLKKIIQSRSLLPCVCHGSLWQWQNVFCRTSVCPTRTRTYSCKHYY